MPKLYVLDMDIGLAMLIPWYASELECKWLTPAGTLSKVYSPKARRRVCNQRQDYIDQVFSLSFEFQ
jgi:hypothetical protein